MARTIGLTFQKKQTRARPEEKKDAGKVKADSKK